MLKEVRCSLHMHSVCCVWSCDVHVTGMITEDPALKVLYGMYCDSGTCMMWTPWGPSVLISRAAPMCYSYVYENMGPVYTGHGACTDFQAWPVSQWNSRSMYTFTKM